MLIAVLTGTDVDGVDGHAVDTHESRGNEVGSERKELQRPKYKKCSQNYTQVHVDLFRTPPLPTRTAQQVLFAEPNFHRDYYGCITVLIRGLNFRATISINPFETLRADLSTSHVLRSKAYSTFSYKCGAVRV